MSGKIILKSFLCLADYQHENVAVHNADDEDIPMESMSFSHC